MGRNHDIAINIGGNADRGLRAVRVTREELARYAAESNRARQSVAALSQSNQSVVGGFNEVGAVVGKVGGVVAAVTGAWSGLSTIINAQIIRDNVALADAIDITAGKLQGWQYAGDRVGIAADKMGNILKDLTEKLGEFARNGGGEAKDILEELGFAAKDFIGLQADEKLLKLAEAIGQMDDRGKQVSALEELGDDAARLLPLLERNADKVKQLLAEASVSGVSMSAEDIETVLDYADAWSDVSGAMGGVQNQLTVLAGNTATGALHGLADVIRENGDAVEYLDEAMIAGSGLMAARYIPAVVDKTNAMYASQKAVITTAKAELNAVKVAERSSAVALRQAQSSQSLAAQRVKDAFAVNATAEARNRAVSEAARKTQALRAAENAHAGDLSRLTNATRKYNAVATVTGRVTGGLKTALGVIGGPAGVALLAGAAILSMSRDYETAEERTKRLEKETNSLVRSLKNASLFDAYAAADSAAEAVLKKQEQLIKAKKALQALEQKKPDRSYKGGAASHDDALEKTRDNIKALQGEYEALQRKAEVAGAGVDGALSRINTGTKTLTETTGKLTAEQIKLINKWAKQTTRIEQLRQQKKQLLATMDKAGELTDKNALALENLNRELAEEAKRLKKVEDKKRPVLEQMQEELALLKAGEKAQYVANKLRGVSVEEMKAQGHQLAVLAGEMYEHEQSTKAVAKATKEATAEVDPFAEAWENAFDRLDDAGADLFKSMFQDMDSFVDAAKNAAQQFAGEWLYATAKSSFGIEDLFSKVAGGGSAGGATAGAGGAGQGFGLLDSVTGGMSKTGAQLSGAFGGFARSGMGQALGLSTGTLAAAPTSAFEAVRYTAPSLTGAGEFISSGLQYSPWGMAGSLLAKPLGIEGSGNAVVDAGLSTAGSIAGGGIGSSLTSLGSFGGPVGAALGALAGLAIGGLFGKKPSDKAQWGGYTGGDNHVFTGGESGDKYDETARTEAGAVAAVVSAFDQSIERFAGVALDESMQMGKGALTGWYVKTDSSVAHQGDLKYTPNGSQDMTGDAVIYEGDSKEAAMDAAVAYLAEKAGVAMEVYKGLAKEGEVLAATYERVRVQQGLVKSSMEALGVPFTAVGDDALRLADQFVAAAGGMQQLAATTDYYYQNYYSEQERATHLVQQYQGAVSEFNREFGTQLKTKADLRAYIDGMGGVTAATADAHAAALGLAPALVGLEQTMAVVQNSAELFSAMAGADQSDITARAQLIADQYKDEYSAAQQLHSDKMKLIKSQQAAGEKLLQQARQLQLSNISFLTPEQRLAEASRQWASTLKAAKAGDAEALSGLYGAGQALITENRSVWGSGVQSVSAFATVSAELNALGVQFGDSARAEDQIAELNRQQLSIEQQILSASQQQLSALSSSYASIAQLPAGLDSIQSLLAGLPSSLAQSLGGISAGMKGASGGTAQPSATEAWVANLYQSRLGRDADAEGLAFWTAQLDTGVLNKQSLLGEFDAAARRNGETIINGVAASIGAGNSVQLTATEKWVAELYQARLRREADPGGLAFWSAQLDTGVLNKQSLPAEFDAAARRNGETVHGSHFSGLPRVPHNDYKANLHVDESVMPASVMRFLRSTGITIGTAIPEPEHSFVVPQPLQPILAPPGLQGADTARLEQRVLELTGTVEQQTQIIAQLLAAQVDATDDQTGALSRQLAELGISQPMEIGG